MDFVEGEILSFDKPLHWTSFDLVAKVRRTLCHALGVKKLKVGHSGTLDPEYVATLQLGATTPSFDMEHEVDHRYPTAHISRDLIDQTIPTFLGEQWQVPPVYSAVSVNGKRAYTFARKGEEVELKPKLLVIDEIEVLSFDEASMLLTIRVVCSKGTYIRALARDIGVRLKSGAYLTALRRTRVGNRLVEDCYQIEDFIASIQAQTI